MPKQTAAGNPGDRTVPKPAWLKRPIAGGDRYAWIKRRARELDLHTVCEEARCPNIGECWQGGTATFMLLGDTCTRGCRFCAIKTSRRPRPPDPAEPAKIADTIAALRLDYAVLTTVDRDDLPDQGAGHIAATIRCVRATCPDLLLEVLIGDFRGDRALIAQIIAAEPAVLAHNLETVERLTPSVRDPRASYQQSLAVLAYSKEAAPTLASKSSLMLGLGETEHEVLAAMRDLRAAGVDFLTLGQYLQPDAPKLPVQRYVPPQEYAALAEAGLAMGFRYVAAGPLVRSSYRAAEYWLAQAVRGDGRVDSPRPR
ncbi:MAG: lipoyl synthase [Candidatus Krumholzibacteria bacterium]|jgi:lipoic acid synthetase|nr:lipoyl synthase [Candidatus Krumholzibacteria bacterium]